MSAAAKTLPKTSPQLTEAPLTAEAALPALTLRKVAIALALVIAAVYGAFIHNEFHFDDSHTIVENPALLNPKTLVDIWTDQRLVSILPANRSYRPLLFINFWFCWNAAGGETWPFHIVKMLTHLVFCLSLFVMWRRLYRIAGWMPEQPITLGLPFVKRSITLTPDYLGFLLALIMAVHPACNECVNYVSASSTLQCATFYMVAFCLYLAWRESGKLATLLLGLLCYACSVLTKEEGITLPAVIVLFEWMRNESFKTLVKRTIPWAVMFVILAFVSYKMLPESHAASRGQMSTMVYFQTQWRAYLWYMRILFWPFDLNADNMAFGFSDHIYDAQVIQAIIGNVALMAVAWFNRKRAPAVLFGVLWFYIAISPASSIVPLSEPVNERRMFLSYAGFAGAVLPFTLLAAGAVWSNRQKWLGTTLALAMVGLVVGSVYRSRVWRNTETLWSDTLEKNPESGRAMNNLALVYMKDGRMEKAIELLERCERVWSGYAFCPLNRGISLAFLKRNEQAKAAYAKATSLNPENADVHFFYGEFLLKTGSKEAALTEFLRADQITGGINVQAKFQAATAAKDLGKVDQAKELLKSLLDVTPNDDRAKQMLGTL